MRSLVLAASALAAALSASPALADPPPWAPAHGYRAKQYHYTYYPAYEVYYAPETRMWFWLDGGNWRMGASLPLWMGFAGGGGGVSVLLDAARPYERHTVVVERYGRPEGHRHHHGDDDDQGERHHGHGRHGHDD